MGVLPMKQKTSVIVPVYNSSEYITRCIDSVIGQKYADIEVVIIDDGSQDNSLAICKDIASKDSRVKVFSQPNCGASSARNSGLDISTGEYVMFVDSDDWIEPEMLDGMMRVFLDNPGIQIVQTRVPEDMKDREGDQVLSGTQAVKYLLEGSWWGPVCKLIRRELISGVRFPEATLSEDYLFNYQLFNNSEFVYYLDKCYYHRTNRPGSLSKIQLSKRKFDEFYNVKEVCDRVSIDYPQYKLLADSHLAGTCLKLLFLIFENRAEKQYADEMELVLDCIRDNYYSFLKNPNINQHQRILLASCFSKASARFSERVYHILK
jgi:glycosyltransferase involved in cell wall biosynthesis